MPKFESPSITGHWRIVSMTEWENDYLDEEEEAYIEFDKNGGGQFHFGYVHGFMDCRHSERDGKPAMEFSWEGNDEMDEASGRGWATRNGDRLDRSRPWKAAARRRSRSNTRRCTPNRAAR